MNGLGRRGKREEWRENWGDSEREEEERQEKEEMKRGRGCEKNKLLVS